MLAKFILFLLFGLAGYLFYIGIQKIKVLLTKGKCTCSKTGESECHCHDKNDDQ